MAKRAILTFENKGIVYEDLGSLVAKTVREEVGRIRGASIKNMEKIMDLLGDVWIDIVQSSVVKPWAVPAHRSTLILKRDLGKRMVIFGWQDFRGDAKARFSGDKNKPKELMHRSMQAVLNALPTGVHDQKIFNLAAATYKVDHLIASAVGATEREYRKSVKGQKGGDKFKTTRRLTHKGVTKRRKG